MYGHVACMHGLSRRSSSSDQLLIRQRVSIIVTAGVLPQSIRFAATTTWCMGGGGFVKNISRVIAADHAPRTPPQYWQMRPCMEGGPGQVRTAHRRRRARLAACVVVASSPCCRMRARVAPFVGQVRRAPLLHHTSRSWLAGPPDTTHQRRLPRHARLGPTTGGRAGRPVRAFMLARTSCDKRTYVRT